MCVPDGWAITVCAGVACRRIVNCESIPLLFVVAWEDGMFSQGMGKHAVFYWIYDLSVVHVLTDQQHEISFLPCTLIFADMVTCIIDDNHFTIAMSLAY